MKYTVYGIPNCNTVKKALDWLKANDVLFEFYDYKKKGITSDVLIGWSAQIGYENLINKRGTTWKQLQTAVQESITNEAAAIVLMQEKTSVIKRPLIALNDTIITLGFDEAVYEDKFL